MIRLSVNVNKIATLRNARGGNNPDLLKMTADIERFGAQGITVHPRPDERHIRYSDVVALKPIVSTEFNIEGYPSDDFLELVSTVMPTQVTLVPDPPNVLTSDAGWDTLKYHAFLKAVISDLKQKGIRTSLFIDPIESMIERAATTGTDRIELYTEAYAHHYNTDRVKAIAPYQAAAKRAHQLGMGVNAGHDLDLQNLRYFAQYIPELLEVSIGHALICDALYLGIENAVRLYLRELEI